MSIYYQDDAVTLYLGDCLTEHREWLEADVLVTDPPYGIAYESNFNRIKGSQKVGRPIVGDKTPVARSLALSAWGQRPALVFGRWDIPRPAGTRARLIWDRKYHGMGDLTFPWGPSEEEIYVLGSGFRGKRGPNIISSHALMSGDKNRPDHPTPKPIGLMQSLIEKCPAGSIADPFAGSGSTLIAAKALGRKSIGVELDERYCEIAAKRLAQGALDLGGAT